MTVDNSQIIVLQANEAPVAISYDSDGGRGTAEESNACYLYKIAQSQKPATQQQQQQQQKQTQQPRGQVGSSDDRQNATSVSTNNKNNAAAQDQDPQQQQHHHHHHQIAAAPKWVRIGDRVCFSTVVAAVLIPSSQDLAPATKRELWWQPADYADFRVNYATHMHNPSIELEEQEREGAGPAAALPVAANAGAPAANAATATVEGVLVVAASPAPAPLTSRSLNPSPDNGEAGGRRHGGPAGGGGGGGSHKAGSGGGGGAAAPPSQDRGSKAKPSRYEKPARSRPVAIPNHYHQHQQAQQQYENAPGRHRVGSGGRGFKAGSSPPQHSASYMAQPQFHGMHQQQQRQPFMRTQGQQAGHAAGFGHRDARHDPYLAARVGSSSRSNHNINSGRYQQHHNGGGRHEQQQQQQFFVNGNPAGVNCPPPPQQQQQPHSRVGAGGAFRRSISGNVGPVVVEAFRPRHAAGGVTEGVAMAPAPAPFLSRVGGGGGAGARAGMMAPPRPAAAVGGGHMPVPFQAGGGGSSSQFSMWRSQVVFAPAMQMQ